MADKRDLFKKNPVAGVAIALGIGMLVGAAGKFGARRREENDEPAEPTPPARVRVVAPDRALDRRTHDVGAADMEFAAHYPDGRNIDFRFAWKKRPVDAPESDWPVDDMGFTLERPDGKHVAFSFVRKARPIDDARPGLGRADMEFISSRPGRGDFRFTWQKTPPEDASGDE